MSNLDGTPPIQHLSTEELEEELKRRRKIEQERTTYRMISEGFSIRLTNRKWRSNEITLPKDLDNEVRAFIEKWLKEHSESEPLD